MSGLRTDATICGKALAQPHARSDEAAGFPEENVEEAILAHIHPKVFADDVTRFAEVAARRLLRDWELFRADHTLGAFELSRPEAT